MFKDLTVTENRKAKDMGYMPLFAERETVQEAYDYMMRIIDRMLPGDKQAAITGFHVFINTMAVQSAKEE